MERLHTMLNPDVDARRTVAFRLLGQRVRPASPRLAKRIDITPLALDRAELDAARANP